MRGSPIVLLAALAVAMTDAVVSVGTPQPACTKTCPANEVCQINSEDNSQFCYNPCAAVLCLTGSTCELEQVQCIRAPCPPIAVCKPIKAACTRRVLRAASSE